MSKRKGPRDAAQQIPPRPKLHEQLVSALLDPQVKRDVGCYLLIAILTQGRRAA